MGWEAGKGQRGVGHGAGAGLRGGRGTHLAHSGEDGPNQSSGQEGRSAAGEGAERWDQVMRPCNRTWGQVSGAAPRPRGGARVGDTAEALKAGLVEGGGGARSRGRGRAKAKGL